jgi:hypothetical protein
MNSASNIGKGSHTDNAGYRSSSRSSSSSSTVNRFHRHSTGSASFSSSFSTSFSTSSSSSSDMRKGRQSSGVFYITSFIFPFIFPFIFLFVLAFIFLFVLTFVLAFPITFDGHILCSHLYFILRTLYFKNLWFTFDFLVILYFYLDVYFMHLFVTLCFLSHLITGSIQSFFSKKNSVESTSTSTSSSSASRSVSTRVTKGWTECSTGITAEKINSPTLIKTKSKLNPKLNSYIESKIESKTLSKTELDFLSGCAQDCELGYGLGLEGNRIGPFSSLPKTLEKDEKEDKEEKDHHENHGKLNTEELHGNSTTQETEIANHNAEYEKERKLNLSVLYGIPSSKIKKTTPKKVSKFFRKISLNGAEDKNNHEIKDCQNNYFNSKNNEITSTVNKIDYDIGSNVNNNNDSHKKNHYNDNNFNNDNHNIVRENNDKFEKPGQFQNLDDSSNLMQFQFNSGINHENQNSSNLSRTYDQFSFQETKSVKLCPPHPMNNEFSSMTQHTFNADIKNDMICNNESGNNDEIEYENKNGDKNENENENKSENNEELRRELKASVHDDDNEVEIIAPYQSPFGHTHTYAQAHTNTHSNSYAHTQVQAHANTSTHTRTNTQTRHDDSVKRVMTRTEKQPAQKKRLVGTSKPFSR